jgi:hypothetical protein
MDQSEREERMISRRGAKLGSLCVLMFGLGGACTVERNLPLGDWPEPAAGAGGSSGSGGSTTGGAGSSQTTAGSGGSAATGNSGPFLEVGCDYITVLKTNCARAGCHNSRSMVSGLDLTPTPAAGLITRLKDQSPTHSEINCGNGDLFVECVPATCPAPGTALLVDSANPDASWILKKLTGTHDECGSQMPMPPGNDGFDASRMACIEQLVRAIAASDGGGPGPTCYSPTNPPDPSGSAEQVGCACSGSDRHCVVTESGHHMALICDGVRWLSVEDGPCEPRATPACQVAGPDLTEIVWRGERVQSPFSACNSCICGDDGSLVDCGGNFCADRECPSGTVPGERCLECGSPGGCGVRETGCLALCESNDDCGGATPNCIDGFCEVGPCF